MFTHTARDDSDVVYRSVFRGYERSIGGRIVPHAVFVDPEIGSVGLTEPAARAAGHDVITGRQDFAGVAKPALLETPAGWSSASWTPPPTTSSAATSPAPTPETSYMAVIAMNTGDRYSDVAQAIHVHPTLAEGVNAAAGGVHHPTA